VVFFSLPQKKLEWLSLASLLLKKSFVTLTIGVIVIKTFFFITDGEIEKLVCLFLASFSG
jgi:hypothetical protein